jgi:hypothetical protein
MNAWMDGLKHKEKRFNELNELWWRKKRIKHKKRDKTNHCMGSWMDEWDG